MMTDETGQGFTDIPAQLGFWVAVYAGGIVDVEPVIGWRIYGSGEVRPITSKRLAMHPVIEAGCREDATGIARRGGV